MGALMAGNTNKAALANAARLNLKPKLLGVMVVLLSAFGFSFSPV